MVGRVIVTLINGDKDTFIGVEVMKSSAGVLTLQHEKGTTLYAAGMWKWATREND